MHSRERDAATTTGQSVHGILDEHLERPFQQHRIAEHRERFIRREDVDRDGVLERGNPLTEVVAEPLHQRGHIHRVPTRLATNALEAVRHPVESQQIGPHLRERGLRRLVGPSLLQQLNPAAETRERRAQLVRRLTRHARPHALALRVAARSHDVHGGEEQHQCARCLEGGDNAQPPDDWRIAVVDLPNERIHDRRVLLVELAHIRTEARFVAGNALWEIRIRTRPSGAIGHDQRNALLPDTPGEIEQRLRGGALSRVALRAKHARIHLAAAFALALEIAHHLASEHHVRR